MAAGAVADMGNMSIYDVASGIASDLNGTQDPSEGNLGMAGDGEDIPMVDSLADDGQGFQSAAPEADPAAGAPPAVDPQASEVPAVDAAASDEFPKTVDGKGFQIPAERWSAIADQAKFGREIQSRFPSIEAADDAYQRSTDHQRIETDYLYGGPKDAEALLNYWAGGNCTNPQLQAQYKEAFQRTFGERLPEFVAQSMPDFHQKITSQFAQPYIDKAYDHAAKTGDPDDLYRARSLDYEINKTYRPDGQIGPAKTSPELDAVRQERQALDQERDSMADMAWQAHDKQNVNGPKWGKFNEIIDKALEPAKGRFSEPIYEAIRSKVHADVLAEMKKDQNWVLTHNSQHSRIQAQFRASYRNRGDASYLNPQIAAFNDSFAARANAIVPGIVKPLVASATAKAVADNQQARQQMPKPRTAPPPSLPDNSSPRRARMSQEDVMSDIRRQLGA